MTVAAVLEMTESGCPCLGQEACVGPHDARVVGVALLYAGGEEVMGGRRLM